MEPANPLNELIEHLKRLRIKVPWRAASWELQCPILDTPEKEIVWLRMQLQQTIEIVEHGINSGGLTDKKKMYDEFTRSMILRFCYLVLSLRANSKPQEQIIQVLKRMDGNVEKIITYFQAKYPEKESETVDSNLSDLPKIVDQQIKEQAYNTIKGALEGTNKLKLIAQHTNWGDSYESCSHEELIKELLEYHLKAAETAEDQLKRIAQTMGTSEGKFNIAPSVSVGLKFKSYRKYFKDRQDLNFQNAEMLRIIIKLVENYEDYIGDIIKGNSSELGYDLPSLDFEKPVNLTKQERRKLRGILKAEFDKMRLVKIEDFIVQAFVSSSGTVVPFQEKNSALPLKDSIIGLSTALISDVTYKTAIHYLQLLIHCQLQAQYHFNQGQKQKPQRRINLLTFRLYDLVRGMMSGTIDEIKEVCRNFHEGKHIMRLKNRINSVNKDIFLNVNLGPAAQHSIFAQMQLKIKQDQSKEHKSVRDILWHDFVHFLYELKRNKLGMISEIFISNNRYNYDVIKYFRDKISKETLDTSQLEDVCKYVDDYVQRPRSMQLPPSMQPQSPIKGNMPYLVLRSRKSNAQQTLNLVKFTCSNCWKHYDGYRHFCFKNSESKYWCECCILKKLDQTRSRLLFGAWSKFFVEIKGNSREELYEKIKQNFSGSRNQCLFLCVVDSKLEYNLVRVVYDSEEGELQAFATLQKTQPVQLFKEGEDISLPYLYRLQVSSQLFEKSSAKKYEHCDILKSKWVSEEELVKLGDIRAIRDDQQYLFVDKWELDPKEDLCKLKIKKCIREKYKDEQARIQIELLESNQLAGVQDYEGRELSNSDFLEYVGKPQELNLSFNQFPGIVFPTASDWSSQLRVLNISNNLLTELDLGSLELAKLEQLNASWNRIGSIILPRKHSIRLLYLHENMLPSIGFKPFDTLEVLSLSENRICGSQEIQGWPNLQQLYLSTFNINVANNFITKVEVSMVPRLQVLHLAGNLLQSVDIDSVMASEEVDVSRNPISDIGPSKWKGPVANKPTFEYSYTMANINQIQDIVRGSTQQWSKSELIAKIRMGPIERKDPTKAQQNYKYRLDGMVNYRLNMLDKKDWKVSLPFFREINELRSEFLVLDLPKEDKEGKEDSQDEQDRPQFVRLIESKAGYLNQGSREWQEKYCLKILKCVDTALQRTSDWRFILIDI